MKIQRRDMRLIFAALDEYFLKREHLVYLSNTIPELKELRELAEKARSALLLADRSRLNTEIITAESALGTLNETAKELGFSNGLKLCSRCEELRDMFLEGGTRRHHSHSNWNEPYSPDDVFEISETV